MEIVLAYVSSYTSRKRKEEEEDFLEAVKSWQADLAPEYDDLEIVEMQEEKGHLQALAKDEKCQYVLRYDFRGNINIFYLGAV